MNKDSNRKESVIIFDSSNDRFLRPSMTSAEDFVCVKCRNQYNLREMSTTGQHLGSTLYPKVSTGNKIPKTQKELHKFGNDRKIDLSITELYADESSTFELKEATSKELEDCYDDKKILKKQNIEK